MSQEKVKLCNALIGFTGFVGSSLLKQTTFDLLFNSKNIHDILNKNFNMVVCAGAPAQKWFANRNPEMDLQNINSLIGYIGKINCKKFILISTVDVFDNPVGVDETTLPNDVKFSSYGSNRRALEKFVQEHFSDYLIVRLPGLVGPGLRKNIVYDLLMKNNLSTIESRDSFQFYPMVNLWFDIQIALKARLSLIHLTAVPISVSDVSLYGFGKEFNQYQDCEIKSYDMQTCHAKIYGVEGRYQYSLISSLTAIRAYVQSEAVVKLVGSL